MADPSGVIQKYAMSYSKALSLLCCQSEGFVANAHICLRI